MEVEHLLKDLNVQAFSGKNCMEKKARESVLALLLPYQMLHTTRAFQRVREFAYAQMALLNTWHLGMLEIFRQKAYK